MSSMSPKIALSLLNFIKIYHLFQKLLVREHRQTDSVANDVSLTFLRKVGQNVIMLHEIMR
jgi:hypothetical protein